MTHTRLWAGLVLGSAAAVSIIARVAGQMPAPAVTAAPPSISGYWELSYDSRKVPKAKLLPAVTPAKIQQRANLDAHAIRWCNLIGLPFAMDPGRPIDIREGPTVVMIAPENVPN